MLQCTSLNTSPSVYINKNFLYIHIYALIQECVFLTLQVYKTVPVNLPKLHFPKQITIVPILLHHHQHGALACSNLFFSNLIIVTCFNFSFLMTSVVGYCFHMLNYSYLFLRELLFINFVQFY